MFGEEGIEMTFEYEVENVLEVLRKNRQQHLEDYKEAVVEYRRLRIDKLDQAMRKLAKNAEKIRTQFSDDVEEDPSLNEVLEDVDLSLPKPIEFLEQYDDMIEQLEMTSQTHFKLSRAVFKQLVQDDWDWKGQWKMSNSTYLAKLQ